jgi:hypothetical protein
MAGNAATFAVDAGGLSAAGAIDAQATNATKIDKGYFTGNLRMSVE